MWRKFRFRFSLINWTLGKISAKKSLSSGRNINGINKDLVFTTKAKFRTRNMTLTEMHGVKLQKKLYFIQNGICQCRYKKLTVYLYWQRIEELGQVFLPQKYTFWSVCHVLKWMGATIARRCSNRSGYIRKYLKIRDKEYLLY